MSASSESSVTVVPMSPVLGAEIAGVDLAGGVTDDDFALIHQAFLEHGVVFFRNQRPLTKADQVVFARRFGPLHHHPAAPADDDGAVFIIHAHRHSPVANGNGWHTDVSCDPEPPMATMLQIHLMPKVGGGDTLFADMEAAYAALPDEMRTMLKTLTARHASEHVYRGRYADRGVDDTDVDYPSNVHPVIRTHPETGRPSIYVNRSFTSEIVGVSDAESERLLSILFGHIEQPEFQIRFRWETNDVAIWDNRRLLHFAIWDYWPYERKGHRVSVLGDRPYFDPDAPDAEPSTLRLSGGTLVQ